jgi:hypothetical protein
MPTYTLPQNELVPGATYEFHRNEEITHKVFLGLVKVQGRTRLAWGLPDQLKRYNDRVAFKKEFPRVRELGPVRVQVQVTASCKAHKATKAKRIPVTLDAVTEWVDARDKPLPEGVEVAAVAFKPPPPTTKAKVTLRDVQGAYRDLCVDHKVKPLRVRRTDLKPVFSFRERNSREDVYRLMPSDDGKHWLTEGTKKTKHKTLTAALKEIVE